MHMLPPSWKPSLEIVVGLVVMEEEAHYEGHMVTFVKASSAFPLHQSL